MTSTLDTSGSAHRRRTRRFATQFGIAMITYAAVLFVSIAWGDVDGGTAWSVAWGLSPMIPIAATAAILIRHLATSDEREVLMSCRALAAAFAVTMLAATTIGFLGFSGVETPGSGWWIYGIGMFAWLVARIWLEVREGMRAR